jgi:2-oxoglutarate dehydrogenase E2 component (dihydrolipoamide succinyltransferase)
VLTIKVPPLGESITEATVARWLKKEGDTVAAGETLVELETDKITVEVPALKAGVLAQRARAEGDVVKVDEVLGELDDARPGTADLRVSQSGQAPGPAGAPAPPTVRPTAGSRVSGPSVSGSSFSNPPISPRAAPSARRAAAEAGVDIAAVPGTGRGGVVSKPDVIAALREPEAASRTPDEVPAARSSGLRLPASGSPRETREKMSTRRKRIAENLVAAQHATAHLTTFNEIDMSALAALRERMRERVEKEHGVKLSFMPFFARAAVLALEAYPVVNARVDGDAIVYHHYVHLGIAVASDAGLIVPVIKDADAMGILALGRGIADLARRARDGKLTMEDLTGGTFTITNGGVFGSLLSTPIINHPQVGILGLHKIEERPVAVGGAVEVRPMMYVALSYDHRIVDGQQAVLFLVKVKELIEDPARMLVT